MAEHSHNAFRGLYDMFAEMGRMREQLTQPDRPSEGGASSGSAWIPAVDIYAQGDDLVIRCELAGVPREDMEVALLPRAAVDLRRTRRRPPRAPT